MAWPGLHLAERAEALRRVPGLRRRAALRGPWSTRGRPQGMPVRGGAEGRDQALGMQGFRYRLYSGARHRDMHGLARGRLRGLLQLRALRAPEGGGMSAVGREERVLRIIETARSKRPRFRDERLTLAHGAGGK